MGKNNIVWDNIATTSPNISGTVSFTYSCTPGGLPGTGNIGSDPMFVNMPPAGYCFLSQVAAGQTQNSPCMDSGDPASPMINGSTRTDMVPDAGVVDMGFHWLHTLSNAMVNVRLEDDFGGKETGMGVPVPEDLNLRIFNHPNPFNPATIITLVLDQASPVHLTVYDAAGKMIKSLFQGNLEAGAHDFLFVGKNLPTGVYLCRADVGRRTVTNKALLVK